MGVRPFRFQKETYYHIYNRGCNKQQLFFSEKDLEHFGNVIIRYKEKYKHIRIHVWCFLPNHFHFLVSEVLSSNSTTMRKKQSSNSVVAEEISKFMQKIQQAYAMYFNFKYKESVKQGKKAPVYEGRFKAKEITDEEYLAQVAYYIRHNAVKHGIVDDVRDWVWAGVTPTEDFPVVEYVGLDPEFDPGFE